MANARSSEDSVRVLDDIARYHEFRGSARTALRYITHSNELSQRSGIPLGAAFKELARLDIVVRAGRQDIAQQTLRRISTER